MGTVESPSPNPALFGRGIKFLMPSPGVLRPYSVEVTDSFTTAFSGINEPRQPLITINRHQTLKKLSIEGLNRALHDYRGNDRYWLTAPYAPALLKAGADKIDLQHPNVFFARGNHERIHLVAITADKNNQEHPFKFDVILDEIPAGSQVFYPDRANCCH